MIDDPASGAFDTQVKSLALAQKFVTVSAANFFNDIFLAHGSSLGTRPVVLRYPS